MTNNLKNIFVILIALPVTICFGQDKPMLTKRIIKEIAKNNYVAPFPDGFFFGETPQYKLFMQLAETATTAELIKYTEDRRPIIRVYAVKCLDKRNYDGLFELAIKHIKDTKKVAESGVHRSRDVYVGDYFVEVQNISESERNQLDSILLFTDNKLFYLNWLLGEIGTNKSNYERIRYLANKNEFAVIALAKYKREEDIKLIEEQILKNSYFTIEAIEFFPTEQFKETLLTLREQGYNYYGTKLAVASFKDSFSIDYFNHSLLKAKGNNYQSGQRAKYIFEAISKYRDTIFTELFFNLWENDQKIDTDIFNYLAKIDKEKCIYLSINSLKKPNNLDNSTLVILTMLDFLIVNDNDAAKELIKLNIDSANVHKLSYFVEKATNFKDQEIVNSMFYRLENTSNGHIYVPIVKTILSFRDKELNERLIKSIKENSEIKDWGMEKVILYLDEYGLKI
ncbi:MAG: hypothetical protein JKX84_10630 [Flavobacteriales bacterium]|nr:hypothetical protein [Flavobacteriales bacterium]